MTADFWLRIALAAAIIIGIWNLFAPGMLLSAVGDWLEKRAPNIGKPIGLCPPCMASAHGTWIWLIAGGHWSGVPIFCLALSGVMVLIVRNLLKDG